MLKHGSRVIRNTQVIRKIAMNLDLLGKKALVCGASKGIGKAIAKELLLEGAELFIVARDQKVLSVTAKELHDETGRNASVQSCDLASFEAREKLIESVKEKFGRLDILIHNSGGPKPSSVEDTSLDAWEQGYRLLFEMVAHLNGAFVPSMKENKWGRIVAVTSLSVMEPISGLAISNAMRSAVTAMLKTLADEVAASNITVNCVSPGAIETDRLVDLMNARIAKSGQDEEAYRKEYLKAIPAGRLGSPEEFAAVVAFLCSQRASYVTGSTICVDGGKRRSAY